MTPVERVSKAVAEALEEQGVFAVYGDLIEEPTSEQVAAIARAAIEALREPSDEMLRVQLAVDYPATYRDHLRHPDNGLSSAKQNEVDIAKAKRRHDAMISQALSETN